MDRLSKINFVYTQLGKSGLTELVKNNKITIDEYETVVGEQCEVLDLNLLKSQKINIINSYKHKVMEFIQYDGGSQRTLPEDKMMMLDCQQSLELGKKTEIVWKYPEKYVVVTYPEYFIEMRLTIGNITEKAFNIEKIICDEINAFTDYESLIIYNEKQRFDELFLENS